MLHDTGPHAMVSEGLHQALHARDLDGLKRWLELGASPRPARQQVVREVLNPSRDDVRTGTVPVLQRVLEHGWVDAVPSLVQAGARLDWGPVDEPRSTGNSSDLPFWFSAVHAVLALASHNAAQWRSSPPGSRTRSSGAPQNPDQDPMVRMLDALHQAGARVNGRDEMGRTPLAMVVGATGWWASDRSSRPTRDGVVWLPAHPTIVEGAVDDVAHLDGPSASVGEALLRVLLRAQADPNRADLSGNTLLQDMVVHTPTFRPFLWVLNAGADPYQANALGRTALDDVQGFHRTHLIAAMQAREQKALRATLDGMDGPTGLANGPETGGRKRL